MLNAVFSTFRLSFSQKHIFSFSVEEDCEEEKKSDEKYVDCRGKIKWTGYQLLPDIYGEAIFVFRFHLCSQHIEKLMYMVGMGEA